MNATHPPRRRALALALVLAAAAGCKRNEPSSGGAAPPPPPRSAADARAGGEPTRAPPAADLEPPAPAAEFRDTARVLPQGEVAGWRQSGAVIRSTAANLSQLIDGAAALYEQYGVQNYAKTDYRRPGTDLVATVEVYEFAAPLGAFGRFTRMLADGRDPATMQPQGVERGGGGYQGSTQLTFWKGRHLVQVSVSDSSDEPDEQAVNAAAREALPRFGEALERAVPGETTQPASPLPTEGLVWGGATYLADEVFGQAQTGPGWVGHYRSPDGKRYRLAILARDAAADAQRAFARLRGAGAVAVPGLGDEAFALPNSPNGELVVARRGTTVFAVADGGAPDQQALDRDGKVAVLRAALAARAPAAPAGGGAAR